MQLIKLVSAAAVVATASASSERNAVKINGIVANQNGQAYIINRCSYDVNIWSVYKGDGCPTDEMVTLKKGQTYSETFQLPQNGVGVSIKISKTKQCKGNDITQFEYFYDTNNGQYNGNYVDISYVDCLGGDCPTMKEGYYFRAGNPSTVNTAVDNANTRNPTMSCTDPVSCAKISYILPDDVQTKYSSLNQSVYYYMCGGQAPSADDSLPASSSKKVESPAAKPTPSKASSAAENVKVNAAAITPAAEIKEPAHTPKVKTNVVYVTKYEYVNAKRHEHVHAHARRHQNFHA